MLTTPDQFMASLGFPETYRVGGSVRDELLGRRSKDSDYMVRLVSLNELGGALVSKGAKISKLKLRTGKQVGWRADVKGCGLIEICLPRAEVAVVPPTVVFGDRPRSRHDFEIDADPLITLERDALRRDFGMNTLYRNVHTQELVDPLGVGRADIAAGRIGTTHSDSFRDDPLRILRALRFVSKYNFKLHPGALQQMKQHAEAVTGLTQKGVSGTAFDELCRMLMGEYPERALRIMEDTGVMAAFLPELAPMLDFEQRSRYHTKTTSDHTYACVQAAAAMHSHATLRVRLALLFHDSGKPTMAWAAEDGVQHYYALTPKRAIELGASVESLEPHEYWSARHAEDALKRLNAPKRLRQDVVTLIERHMLPIWDNIRPYKVRLWRSELGDELLHDLITHRTCDVLGKGGDCQEHLETLAWIADQQRRAIADNVPTSTRDLDVSGHDLISLGLKDKALGDVMKQLLQEVVAQPKLNSREWLLARAVKLVGQQTRESAFEHVNQA